MSRRKKRFGPSGNAGCSFMLMTALLICALMLINGLLVKAFVTANLPQADVRITQAAQFVFPIAMIFIEFWVFDAMTARRKKQAKEPVDLD